jgi:hypothetical protein
LSFFKINKGVLGNHKRGCAKFASFWMKKSIYVPIGKSAKRAKKVTFVKGQIGGKKYFF